MTDDRPPKTDAQKAAAEKQIKELQREVKYDLRDFVIDYIVQEFRNDLFYIPDYQREYIWRDHHRWRFIESILLGLPVPMMFVADIEDDGRLEIVDGAQRIQTLEAFMNNDIELQRLERLPALNGFRFSDLTSSQQNKFKTKALRIVVLEDSTTEVTRKEIFERINTSGEKAKASEVRRGAFAGPFMDFIERCAEDPLFQKLCPVSPAYRLRREPQELVLRFFAFSEQYLKFKHAVEQFLNRFVKDHQQEFDQERFEADFDRMLQFVDRYFPYGFAKQAKAKTTPRVRFEAIAVGTNLALRIRPDLRPGPITWLDSDEFAVHTTSHATNSRPRLRGRIEFVRDQLLEGAE